jgi:FkbM family methyltransferase
MAIPSIFLRAIKRLLGRFVPRRWQLPFVYYLHVFGPDCEPELKFLEQISSGRNVALDIGANVGYYTYKMAKMFSKVYAFEANPNLVDALRAYGSPAIEVIPKGLSSRATTATLYIPLQDNRQLVGWASLTPGNCPGVEQHVQQQVELVTLDSFGIRSVSLVKIDVEGHEIEVLKGARQTLTECRPVVIVEVTPKNVEAVQGWFAGIGYGCHKLRDLIGRPGSEDNYLFLPKRGESLAETS